MPDGSAEVVDPFADVDLAALEAMGVDASLDQSADDEAGDDQATATDGTTAEEATPDKPETPEPAEGEVEDGNPAPPSEVDLSHLPGDLREALVGQPVAVQKAADKVYRSMQADATRKTQAAAEREGQYEAAVKQAELLDTILKHPEARALALQAADIAAGKATAEPEQVPDLTEMEPDELYRTVRKMAQDEADAKIAALKAQSESVTVKRQAIVDKAREIAAAHEVTEDVARSAWQATVEKIQRAGSDVDASNLDLFFEPQLELAKLRAAAEAHEKAKPAAPGGARAATPRSPSSKVPVKDVPVWEREKRAPTQDEIIRQALKESGVSVDDFAREMNEGF